VAEIQLAKTIPTQMPNTAANKVMAQAVSTVGSSVQGTVLTNFVVNLLLSGSLQYIWGMINSLQIVFHMPGCAVNLPGNAKVIYSEFIQIT